jgi:hypothetical protein
MQRRTLPRVLAVLAGLTVLLAFGTLLLWPRGHASRQFTRQNFDCIQSGMSRAEVEGILGPPGDYTNGPTQRGAGPGMSERQDWSNLQVPSKYVSWESDEGSIEVRFASGGGWNGAYLKSYLSNRKVEQSPLENFLWRARRQWQRWFP